MLFECSSESFSPVHDNTLVQKLSVFDAILPVFCGYPRVALQPYIYKLLPTQPLGYAQIFPKLRDSDEPPPFEATTKFNQRLAFNRFGNLGSMSSTEATQVDKYDLVSSFYGPGAVGGWYLAALACVISLSLHPRKRSRDSITADLIAVLTFPTVAAADLITQVRSYPKEGTTSTQNAASIQATLIVIEGFLYVDVILFGLAVGFGCVKRPCLLATVGLFCFSTDCYVYFSPFVDPGIGQQLDGLFMWYFATLSTVILWLSSGICAALSLVLIFFLVFPYRLLASPSERDVEATRRDWVRDFARSRGLTVFEIIIMVVGPIPFIIFFPVFSTASVDFPSQSIFTKIAHDMIPTSNTSIKELDQAVALLAGATVLGFNLYSIADTYYQA